MTTIALKLNRSFTVRAANLARRRTTSLRRLIAHRWDLVAVLFLIVSSAAYAIWALCHLG